MCSYHQPISMCQINADFPVFSYFNSFTAYFSIVKFNRTPLKSIFYPGFFIFFIPRRFQWYTTSKFLHSSFRCITHSKTCVYIDYTLISDGERNSYIKILLEAIELPPLKILSESTINLILRLYRKVINVIVGKSCHQNEKGQATGKTCRPRLTLPPARRVPAAPLTPRPTAFHSPASIRRFSPDTRHKYCRQLFNQIFKRHPFCNILFHSFRSGLCTPKRFTTTSTITGAITNPSFCNVGTASSRDIIPKKLIAMSTLPESTASAL